MRKTKYKLLSLYLAVGLPSLLSQTAMAATSEGDIHNVQGFIKSIITVLAGLAGLVATGFFVIGGFHYIMSSGNPEHMDRAKRTITWSAIGLAVVIAAFVISNIITNLATSAFGS